MLPKAWYVKPVIIPFSTGIPYVWIVEPKTRTVLVYRSIKWGHNIARFGQLKNTDWQELTDSWQ